MKKIIFLLLAAAACLNCGGGKKQITVLSYNIRYATANDGANSWDNRKSSTLKMFNDIKPDLVGMQEVLKNQYDYIAENMSEYGMAGVGRDDGEYGGEMMAVMYRKKRFELLETGNFWLSQTPEKVSKGWDGACNRMVTWLRLRDKKLGKEVFLFNTHLDHEGQKARAESSKLIVAKIREIAGDNIVFLTGDFNAGPDNGVLAPIAAAYLSARDEAPETDNSPTFNDWGQSSYPEPIDHIYYQDAVPLVFEVVKDGYGSEYISDHYPVKAVFRFE